MQVGRVQLEVDSRRRGAFGRGCGLAVAASALCGLLALPGCSRPAAPQGAASGASAPPAVRAGASAADRDAHLVGAVGSGPSGKPISVRFRISARPVLGVPLQILVAVIPADDAQISRIHGSFLPDSGLQLQGDRTFDASDVHAGTPLERELTVIPEHPGVLNLNATFTVDSEASSVSRSYAIPVIVGDNSS